ncbi:MAG: hypothetical protein LBC30_03685 [Puniceicoccales bacterium]|jgi:hypothetical protein|nr:hypothetical protein [Puniceicoccales bacterium]
METNSQNKSLPVPSDYGEPIKLPPFDRAGVGEINAFEKELGIKIPREIYGSIPMYKFGYYFSSKDGFLGTHTDHHFIELLKDRSNVPLVAFGQAGYGFNSGRFELYYINDTLGYKLDVPFGGAFMDNDAIAKEITKLLVKLPVFMRKYKSSGDKTITVIFDRGETGQRVDKISL